MKRLKRVALLSGMLFFAVPIAAQEATPSSPSEPTGTVSGIVLDLATGRPLSEALVTVTGRSIAIRTDAEGNFRLVLPAGTYELRISRERSVSYTHLTLPTNREV